MSVCVIFNPAARGEKATRFRAQLGTLARHCTPWPTTGAGSGVPLAAEAVRKGFETIVAAGGDGTVNEVLNGIGSVPEALARVRLGVVPLGTTNVFARELGLPAHIQPAWAIIERGRDLLIDVGVAEAVAGHQSTKRYFLQMAGAGWDARVTASVHWEHKKKIGQLAYVLAGAQALRGPQANVTLTAGTHSLSGPLALIGNGRFYAGSWRVFPRADLQDGLLEATVFPRWNWWAAARAVLGIALNRVYTLGGARHLQAPVLQASSPEPLPFHVEAENAGVLPARFSVLPRALRVIVP